MSDGLLSTSQAAKYLDVSRWTIKRYVKAGKLQALRDNKGAFQFNQKELDVFLHTPKEVVEKTITEEKVSEIASKEEPKMIAEPKNIPIVQEAENPPVSSPEISQPKKSFLKWLFTGIFCLGVGYFCSSALLSVLYSQGFIGDRLPFQEIVEASSGNESGIQTLDGQRVSTAEIFTSGDTIAASSKQNFNRNVYTSFPDSPFPYLAGQHGVAHPVAVIDHEETLKSHPFFINAHNGDKLLIYQEAKKAIVLRPLTNEVIAFGPLESIPENSWAKPREVMAVIRNGMGVPYDMEAMEEEIRRVTPQTMVVATDIAGRNDYKYTVVVDATGTNTNEAGELARKLRASVVSLPDGERQAPAGVDLLVIVGKDRTSFFTSTSVATPSATPKK